MYSLLPYNTFGIDVSANRFIEYVSVEELKTLIEQGGKGQCGDLRCAG